MLKADTYGILSHNKMRRRWAISKITKIKKKIEKLGGWTEEKSLIISNAQAQIEEFCNQYELEIKIAEKKAENIEVAFYCFTEVTKVYSELKAKVKLHKETYPAEKINDKYGELIRKLWVDFQMEREDTSQHIGPNDPNLPEEH